MCSCRLGRNAPNSKASAIATQEAAMPDSFDLPSLTRQVADALPVAPTTLKLGGEATGLIIVDEVNGFATVGSGNLAPPKDNPQVSAMVDETVRVARGFSGQGWPILAFLDPHRSEEPTSELPSLMRLSSS